MNAFNDASNHRPDINRLRELFVELDTMTLSLFEWGDIEPTYDFRERNNLTRFTVDSISRDEILHRLLKENHRRAAAQGEAPPAEPEEDEE